jgi:glutamine cyclotransferase
MFGEGITLWDDRIIQLTWQHGIALVYNRAMLEREGQFDYSGEGWGLTHDDHHLIMSDGTSSLTFRNPADFRVVRRITVKDGLQEVRDLNELEYIEGEVYANVWHQERIARISPETGEVLAWLDLTGLRPNPPPSHAEAVLNGIAYDPHARRLFVTGKWWSEVFEIRQVPR